MSMKVRDLVSTMNRKSRVINVPLRDVELVVEEGDSFGSLRVGDEFFPWGNRNTQMVAGFLKGPGYKYLEREDLEWQRAVIKHHTDKKPDQSTLWYVEDTDIAGVYYPETKIIPLAQVAHQVADVADPDDDVEVRYGPDQVEVNVTSRLYTVTVPGIEGVPSRPLHGMVTWDDIPVGDISAGGCRIIIQPSRPERAPEVEEYWLRKECENGLTRRIAGSQIQLRGRTVDEILLEMNNTMRAIWGGLEASGRAILHSAQTPIPGATSDFIRQVSRERKINAKTVLRLQERAAGLHDNPTVYDLTQVFTALANEEGLPVLTRRSLQAIGGDLTIDTERMVHRCRQCEQLLPAA